MPTYKLTYFNGRGRAEIIRLIFAAAGVEYEDHRVEREQWPALKPGAPFGQMPILEVDGHKLCQSNACARYLARKFHLAGHSDLEQAQVDMIVDCFEDTAKPIISYHFEKDEARKAELKKKYLEETLPANLALLEKLLTSNHGGDHFFVGKDLTWADLAFFQLTGWLAMGGAENPLEKYPKLKALKGRVEQQPKIAAWIAKRPETQF